MTTLHGEGRPPIEFLFSSVLMPAFFSACQTLTHQEAPEDTITSGCLPSRLDLAAESSVVRYSHYFTRLFSWPKVKGDFTLDLGP